MPKKPIDNTTLLDAIAAEVDDGSDCIELEAMHAAQRIKKMSDVERVECALAVCVSLDLGAPLFAALECDLAMLRARDRCR